MIIYIKNMVCNRCIMVVREEFEKFGFPPVNINLGEVETASEIPPATMEGISRRLQSLGFEIIDNQQSLLIEKIKTTIIQRVHYNEGNTNINLSGYLSEKLNKDYHYLSNLFSEIEGTTIEKYFIHQKIERVKELLVYGELTLSEIADKLGYSSVAYLSNQFKKVTGLTPSHFKRVKDHKRKPLDEV